MDFQIPVITVALPIYNAEKTLKRAVESIINQSFQQWELLLLDDGSTDASLALAAGFSDSRIRCVSDGQNKGISFRLNQAVQMARGRYFCRMDADDISFPERLASQFRYMEAHPLVDLVSASIVTFDRTGQLGGVVRVAHDHQDICARPWNGFHFPHPTWFGRISWFRLHAYSSSADGSEDQLLLYSTHQCSTFAGMHEVLLGYRDDRTSFSRMLRRRLSFWRAIGGCALQMRRWGDLLHLNFMQPAKIAADYLNICLRVAVLRNKRAALDQKLVAMWEKYGFPPD